MDYGSFLEAPPPIISTLRSLKKWALKKTISESTLHLHIELLRCGDLFRREPINEKLDNWHREKIEATDRELQQRKSDFHGPESNPWQAFSEVGAQTTIANLNALAGQSNGGFLSNRCCFTRPWNERKLNPLIRN
ncbi:hypothetical protein VitviT2T_028851 [Vitis vinifera]|uniref:Uncharacterized protein n=1 Tax=Vitis vinifera TaxID=29760 RepID=A0ABY9DUD3_VITVI|nr:hypothetical protein VitviT2T_028851 [Vitis vinifera]